MRVEYERPGVYHLLDLESLVVPVRDGLYLDDEPLDIEEGIRKPLVDVLRDLDQVALEIKTQDIVYYSPVDPVQDPLQETELEVIHRVVEHFFTLDDVIIHVYQVRGNIENRLPRKVGVALEDLQPQLHRVELLLEEEVRFFVVHVEVADLVPVEAELGVDGVLLEIALKLVLAVLHEIDGELILAQPIFFLEIEFDLLVHVRDTQVVDDGVDDTGQSDRK